MARFERRSWIKTVLATAGVLAAAPLAALAADKPDTPTTLKGAQVITADQAKALVDGKGAAFFDTRSALNYGKGHIPGAQLVAYKEKSDFVANFDASVDNFDMAKLPQDKAAKIVIYSDGPQGWKSYKAAAMAVTAGYKNVMWMREGFAAWSAKGLPSAN